MLLRCQEFAKALHVHILSFPHTIFTSYLQILLSQEKNIQQLNELIESLQRQLLHCRGSNNTSTIAAAATSTMAATEVSEAEGQELIDD